MKPVQRLYYLLSCRLLLFTGKMKMKREVFSVLCTEATASVINGVTKRITLVQSLQEVEKATCGRR